MFTYPIFGGGLPTGLQEVDYIVYQNTASGTITERSFNTTTGVASVLKTTGSLPNVEWLTTDGEFVFAKATSTLHQYAWNGSAFTSRDTTTISSNSSNGRIVEAHPNRLWMPGQQSFSGEISLWSYTSAPTYSTVKLDETAVGVFGRWQDKLTDVHDTGEDRGSRGSILVSCASSSGYRPMAVRSSDSANITEVGTSDANTPFSFQTACIDRYTGSIYGRPTTSSNVAIYELNKSTLAMTYIGVGSLPVNISDLVAYRGFLVAWHTDSTLRSYSRSGNVFTQISSVAMGATGGDLEISPYSECIYTAASAESGVFRLGEAGTLTKLGNSGIGTQSQAYNCIDFGTAPLATV